MTVTADVLCRIALVGFAGLDPALTMLIVLSGANFSLILSSYVARLPPEGLAVPFRRSLTLRNLVIHLFLDEPFFFSLAPSSRRFCPSLFYDAASQRRTCRGSSSPSAWNPIFVPPHLLFPGGP